MKNGIHKFLSHPTTVIFTILISSTLTYFTGGIGYIFGLIVALTVLWTSNFKWSIFGFGKPVWKRTVVMAIVLAITIFIIVDVFIQPIVEFFYGAIDLSSLDGIRGNFANYILFIVIMWIVAAIGEEFLYRGYFMKQLAKIFGDTNNAWLISAFVTSILFGMAHNYQGISGMITTGLIGLFLALVFYKNRNNLVLAMLIHGLYDMIGITLIFLNKERAIIDWIQATVTK